MQTNSAATPVRNRFNQLVGRIQALPVPVGVQQKLVTLGFGLAIPYMSTSSIDFVSASPESATLRVRNRRKVQNHMKSVHASAMFMLAESATGTVLSANLPEGSRFSTTHIEIDYKRRAQGDLQATATLSAEQREQVRSQAKGRLAVPVRLFDQNGDEPATFVIEWAWKHPKGE